MESNTWDRGRPARIEHRRCEILRVSGCNDSVLRAHCGRDARGPSEELELSGS